MARGLPDCGALEIRLTPGREDAYNVETASGARGYGQFAAPAELDAARQFGAAPLRPYWLIRAHARSTRLPDVTRARPVGDCG